MRMAFDHEITLAPSDTIMAHARDGDGKDVIIELRVQSIVRGQRECSQVKIPAAPEFVQ